MATTFQSPVLCATTDNIGTYVDTRNTPFSIGTYKVVFNTRNIDNAGNPQFTTRWRLTEPLRGVKWVKLLYAQLPNVQNSDALYIIRSNLRLHSQFVSTFPPRHGVPTTSANVDVIQGSFATLLNTTPAGANTFFTDGEYHVVHYSPTTVDIEEVEFEFFNSTGTPLLYEANQEEAILCLEIYCQGEK